MDREGFIAIISSVRDLIFTEKIAACYISSVGAGLAPALYEYISYYGSNGAGADSDGLGRTAMGWGGQQWGWGKPSPYYFYFSSLFTYLAYFTFSKMKCSIVLKS